MTIILAGSVLCKRSTFAHRWMNRLWSIEPGTLLQYPIQREVRVSSCSGSGVRSSTKNQLTRNESCITIANRDSSMRPNKLYSIINWLINLNVIKFNSLVVLLYYCSKYVINLQLLSHTKKWQTSFSYTYNQMTRMLICQIADTRRHRTINKLNSKYTLSLRPSLFWSTRITVQVTFE